MSDAWARSTAPGQTVGAVYFRIEADADASLTAISIPADVAASAEIHETVVDDAHAGHDSALAQRSMRELGAGLELPEGEAVSLAPGGTHVMLVDLAGPLVAGTTFRITLEFDRAEALTIDVPVSETEP